MLEAFLPNRGWNQEADRWMYMPADQHDTDLRIVVSWAKWRAEKAAASSKTPMAVDGQTRSTS